MFTTLIVQPIFNILVLIYALIPGHNFGLAIILFTILIRFAMYPLLKKQLRNTVRMRALQPELKKIKQATKGDKQKESLMTMELYKEKGVNPFSSIGLLIVQIPLFLALFIGIRRVVEDPQQVIDFAYPFVQNVGYMRELAGNIDLFDNTLFGLVDLNRAAFTSGSIYWPAMIIVLASSFVQWLQIKQTMPSSKDGRTLRSILREANTGKQADSSEVNAAVGQSMARILPLLIFVLTVGFAAALSLYWFISGVVAYIQQAYLLKQDEYDMQKILDKPTKTSVSGSQASKKKVSAKTKTTGPSPKTIKKSSGTKTTIITKKGKKGR